MDEYIKRAAIMEFPIRKDHCDKERANEHFIFGIESVLEYVQNLPAADVAPVGWISVKDRLPEPETEVLAVCVRNGYRFICPVIYEAGTTLTQDSIWNWYEVYNYGTYSEENDDYFIPEGWWEARHFTPDDVYNNPVDCAVTHWMPLPEPPKGARMDGGADNETD